MSCGAYCRRPRNITSSSSGYVRCRTQVRLARRNTWSGARPSPNGLAQAFIIGREFVGNDLSILILGDNIFYGHDLVQQLANADARKEGATIFAYHVRHPECYGVVEFDERFRALSIEEKSPKPRSNYAVTAL